MRTAITNSITGGSGVKTAAALLITTLAGLMGGCPTAAPDDLAAFDAAAAQPAEFAFGGCPISTQTLMQMNTATYAVVMEYSVTQGEQTTISYAMIGTAFGLGPRLLGTNGHVVQAVVDPQPLPTSRVLAVQAGTGKVVELLRAMAHPDYTGDPINSPDVGLFTSKEELPSWMALATPEEATAAIAVGNQIALAGFPGDVNDILTIVPGQTVPQATTLTGTITAVRSFDRNAIVTPQNTDHIQHQAPTTPGTSGSAIVSCGKVVAANNAGTVKVVATLGADGQVEFKRQASASNNFGIHVKHLWLMVDLFTDNAIQGSELPPTAIMQPQPQQPGNPGGANDPAADGGAPGNPGENGDRTGLAALVGSYAGGIQDGPAAHTITLTINADGSVLGQSNWGGNLFNLFGQVDASGNLQVIDDGDLFGLPVGIYIGTVNANGAASGNYAETDPANILGNWTASRQ